MNNYYKWYSRVVWIGILSNFALAVPSLFAANAFLSWLGMPTASPEMWPSFSANLLILLSLFYIPAALDPIRYSLCAWLTIVARLAGVVFFLGFNQDYLVFGLFDLAFLIPQFALLMLARRNADWSVVRMRLAVVALPLVLILAMFAYWNLFRQTPPKQFASNEEHFLYGSVGTEAGNGVPYWIWLVLPRVFPDLLPAPGGYEALGLYSQEGHELPAGITKRHIGFDRVSINCAFCHAGTYRLKPSDKPAVVPGAPTQTVSPQNYLRFLFACARDPRFNSQTIMAEIDKNYHLSWTEHALYKYLLVPFTKRTLLQQQRVRNIYGFMQENPPWGRGRIDPFNPIKYQLLRQPVDGTIGNSDMVPLWNQKQHANYSLHWDGLNTNLQEVVITSAIGDGTPLSWVDEDWGKSETESSLKRVKNFISEIQPPKFPYPVDATLAAKGKLVYDRDCAACHAIGGARTGTVEPVDNPSLKTDPHRIAMWTAGAAQAYNDYAKRYTWKFNHFVKVNGYVNVPMEGIWLRGPYLHNGSVPTLADLLEQPENRPKLFYRGYDVVDPVKVGFVTDWPEKETTGFRYDTAVQGNSNQGHLWGTQLPPDDKRAMLEYMKTL